MNTDIIARLAKGGSEKDDVPDYRVQCGRIDDRGRQSCGFVLGRLQDHAPHVPQGAWRLSFPSGWIENDKGVWQSTKYARTRLQRDLRLAASQSADPEQRARAQHHLAAGRSTKNRRAADVIRIPPEVASSLGRAPEIRQQVAMGATLPCRIQCPKCNGINVADVDLIGEARSRFCATRG